ncbi:MAG: hypothetical protein LQ349_008375 [Xanthoria aureola]|nr:MAG: hypothetical protein LQ349_008375 [Xanthoria aureola]
MSSFVEICDILGQSWSGVKSKGRPSFIRKHLEEFAHHWSRMNDKEMLAKFFLSHHGKKLFSHPECSPKLPEHHDEISGLVAQAFRLLDGAQPVGKTGPALRSENFGSTETKALEGPDTLSDNNPSAGLVDGQSKVKNEDKCDNLPEPTADESITTSAPSPVVTSNNFELVNLLKDWIDSHPNLRIPELSKYDRNSLEDNFAIEASLVETGARVWILRLGVLDMYQGWVLEKPDGSKMLVRSHYRKGGHVYYGWLGGELGYSDEVIANHHDVPRLVLSLRLYARRRKLDAEDVLNEYDVSNEALEFENREPKAAAGGAIEDGVESDTALSSPPSESESDEEPIISRASRKRGSGKANSASRSKKRAKLSTSSTTNPKGANDLLGIDAAEVRRKVKKLHKVFPAVTIAVCECVLLKNKGNVDNALDDLYGLQTSTDSTISDDGPPAQATRRSQRAKPTANPPCTPSPARTKNANTTYLATPFSSSAHSPSSSLAYPPTPHTPSSLLPRTNQPTTLKFFLADPTLGAIPIPYHSIKSRQKFFSEAIAAHFLTSGAAVSEMERESVVAVSVCVRLEGMGMGMMGSPIVVRRGKGGNVAWEQVGRVVGEGERVGGGGGVEVEVRCVVQVGGEGG